MRNYYSYIETSDSYFDESSRATYKGITIKTTILTALTIAIAAVIAFFLPTIIEYNSEGLMIALIGASIIGFISVLVGRFIDSAAKICSVIYAVCEGLVLGTVTCIANAYYPGAGTLCVTATLVIFTIMLVLYSFGFIRNGSKVRMIAFGLLFAALALCIVNLIYYVISGTSLNSIYMLLQLFLLLYGVITLTFNFAEAEAVVGMGASKNAEWSVALGILVSLIYIYIYLLRIIMYIGMRRK